MSTLSAGPGDILEAFFRLNAAATLSAASVALDGANATGDGAVTGILDVCAGDSFLGAVPIDCFGVPGSVVVAVADGISFPSDSVTFAPASFFDVFVDLTVDGGLNGSATFTSATIGLQAVPEPGLAWLVGGGLAILGLSRVYRNNSGGQS
jgi:hypothetical protein